MILLSFFTEHQNFFGLDDNIGPVAVSVKREKLSDGDSVGVRPDPATGALYQYRIIVRTSEVSHDDVIKWKHFPRDWPFVRGLRWIPRTKASDAELWCFLWSAPE